MNYLGCAYASLVSCRASGCTKFGAPPLLDGSFGKISMLVSVTSEPVLVTSVPVLVTSEPVLVAVSEKVCTFAPSSETEVGT